MGAKEDNRHIRHSSIEFDSSFESKFPIGEPIIMESKDRKYHSVMRGALFGKYVLVDVPRAGDKMPSLDFNSRLTVRFMLKGKMYGFKAFILRNHSSPPLLVIEYPRSITMFDLRNSPRVKMTIPISFAIGGDSSSSGGAILDLSKSGALVATDTLGGVAKDSEVEISFPLPGTAKTVSILCSVKSIKLSNRKAFLGVMFTEKNNGSLAEMRNFYQTCLSYQTGMEN
ncbi:MAG: PilZ domain-containing protein [Nitrospinota bacterium]